MNLHKALDKLNAETPQPRSETEERDLGTFHLVSFG
jgi:hypothetical protein